MVWEKNLNRKNISPVTTWYSCDQIEFANFFHPNNQWDVIGTSASHSKKYFSCCQEPFPEVNFEIRLRRRSPYYKQVILYPTFAIVILTLATFWLPPDSISKIILGGFSFVALVIILAHLSWKIPPTGKTVPMIGESLNQEFTLSLFVHDGFFFLNYAFTFI